MADKRELPSLVAAAGGTWLLAAEEEPSRVESMMSMELAAVPRLKRFPLQPEHPSAGGQGVIGSRLQLHPHEWPLRAGSEVLLLAERSVSSAPWHSLA